jgi:tRNA threonylcarbamoyladenosine biosynthesis protein TsaB
MILALETGGNLASLSLLDGVEVVAERSFRHRMSLSRDLMPAIDQMLAAAEVPWEDVDAVAVGLGPGSYTGLRIGLVTAKTLAWASDRPLLGISSLAALVAPYPAAAETLLCAVLEARPGEFFTALYQRRDEALHIRAEPTVLRTAELAVRLASYPGPVLVAGHAHRFGRHMAECSESEATDPIVPLSPAREPGTLPPGAERWTTLGIDEEPQARWVGRLSAQRLRAGERDHPAALVPLYVRAPAPTLKPPDPTRTTRSGQARRAGKPQPTMVSEGSCRD